MKPNLILLILLFFGYKVGFCQGSFINSNKVWNVLHENSTEHIHPDDPYPFKKTTSYKIEGDTIIEEKNYKNLFITEDSLLLSWEKYDAIREEGMKVYYHNYSEEILLYDFDVNVNDTLILVNNHIEFNYVLDSIGTYQPGNSNLKAYYFSIFKNDYPEWKINDIWIDGIGSQLGLLRENCFFSTPCNHFYQLLCVHENDTLLFLNPDYGFCFVSSTNVSVTHLPFQNESKLYQNVPNPFSEQTNIRFEIPETVQNAQLHICNMMGTLLKTIPVNQKGEGYVTINANEFAAGMYLYSLVCDGKIVDTKQMLLTE